MDATLQIIIRAQARQAQTAIAGVTTQLNALQRMGARMNSAKFTSFFDMLGSSKLVKAGKNLQWVGRQLIYNFTLPLGLAGVALFKFTQSVERELTQLRKVYGDVNEDQAMLKKETDALAESFKLLSSYYGVNQAEVAKVGAMWAQAGSAGRGLAENVKATMEVMILGDMEAVAATEALIAVQGTWRLSTKKNASGVSELMTAMAELNIIENQTGIGFEGLMDVYARAGGVARTAGMQFSELGAFAAALVPATGSAAQAGNALKTIISRLQAPTKDTIEVLEKMGITVMDESWLGLTATQKIELMAERFEDLSSANKNFVSSIIASRWQVNRFSVLMDDVASGTGYYAKALKATSDESKVLQTYNRELTQVLQSSPKRWDILTNTMKNALADAFIPLLPAIFEVMRMITRLAQAFSDLSPQTQKWIIFGLAAIATVGPILVMIGSFETLLGVVFKTAQFFGVNLFIAIWRVGKLMTIVGTKALFPLIEGMWWLFVNTLKVIASLVVMTVQAIPPAIGALWAMFTAVSALAFGAVVALIDALIALGVVLTTTLLPAITVFGAEISLSLFAVILIIAAVVGAVLLLLNDDFRSGLMDFLNAMGRALWWLPQLFVDVFNAVIRVLARAMEEVVDLLSYLNPFARHSPSLVDNVKAGVATILDEYAQLRHITPMISGAVNALESFGQANAGLRSSRREKELREKANQPGVVGGNQLVDSILALEGELPKLTIEINAQKMVVATWDNALKAADKTLSDLETQLDSSQAALDLVTDKISAATSEISRLANVPLIGMGEMEDQIFANEQATRELQLQMLEFERSGKSIQDLQDKYAALNGEIEMLGGERENLRLAGAGSDILSTYDDQIDALQDQKGELAATQDEIQGIQDKLDALDLEHRFLNLTKDITFAPLLRDIDKMANGIEEMSFDAVVAGIQEQQRIIAELLPQQTALTDQVAREQLAVDAAKASRDGIAAQLDIEQQKLDGLEQAYTDINDLIREMEGLLDQVSSDAKAAQEEAAGSSFIDDMFAAGEGVDYPIEGGGDILGREGTLADIEAFNDEMQQKLDEMLRNMGIGDIFEPIKKKWEDFKGWITGWWDRFKGWFWTALDWVVNASKTAWNETINGMKWLWDEIVKIWNGIWNWVKGAFWTAWNAVSGAMVTAWNATVGFFKTIWNGVVSFFTTIWDAIVGVFHWAWERIKGIWNGVVGFFQGVWNRFQSIWDGSGAPVIDTLVVAWGGFADFFQGVWDAIVLAGQEAWGFIQPIFQAIWDFINNYIIPIVELVMVVFQIAWALMYLAVSGFWHYASIIWNEINDFLNDVLIGTMHWVGEQWDEIINGMERVWGWFGDAAAATWDALGTAINATWDFIRGIWNTINDWLNRILIGTFRWFRDQATTAWEQLGTAITWTWDHVILGTFHAIDDFIHNTLFPAFEWLRDNAVRAFSGMGVALQWVWDHSIGPIFEGFQDVFENHIGPAFVWLYQNARTTLGALAGVFASAWSGIASAIETGVNFFIGAFNALAGAVNTVADMLHITQRVGTMPNIKLPRFGGGPDFSAADKAMGSAFTVPGAGGGGSARMMAAGGKVMGAQTIVGEGSKVWPEFVIPTDPRHRGNARGLYSELGNTLFNGDGLGDIFGSAKKMASSAVGQVGGWIKEGAIKVVWDPVKAMVNGILGRMPEGFFKGAAGGVLGMVDAWIRGSGDAWDEASKNQTGARPQDGAGSWGVIPPYLAGHGVPFKVLSTYRPGAVTRFTGAQSWHALNRAIDLSGPSGMVNYNPKDLLAINQAIYTGFKPWLKELIYGGPGAKNVFRGQDHTFSNVLMKEHINHVHAALARGGFVVPRRPGGALLRVGEGIYNEKVQVTPLDGRHGDGETTINFYDATFSFPNMTDPNDAERFLGNIEALAGRH